MKRFMDKNDLQPILEYVKADNSLDLEMKIKIITTVSLPGICPEPGFLNSH